MTDSLKVVSADGTEKGSRKLSDKLFSVEPNLHLLHKTVTAVLTNRRQGTSATKGRSDVRGSGRKAWRQKGTGRARAGSTRPPHWRGGGHSFAKRPKKFDMRLPKAEKRKALSSALSLRADQGDVVLTEDLSFQEPSTKKMAQILSALGVEGQKILMVVPDYDINLFKSIRNIPGTKISVAKDLNALLVMDCQKLVITETALARMEEVFGTE